MGDTSHHAAGVKARSKHRKTRYCGQIKVNVQLFTLFGFANPILARRFMGAHVPKLRPGRRKRLRNLPEMAESRLYSVWFDRKS